MTRNNLIELIEPDAADPRIQAALTELRTLISIQYPDATFSLYHGADPDGMYLRALVDVEDLDEVMDVYMDRLVDLQVNDGLPVYVALDWPLTRVREYMRHKQTPAVETRLPATWP